MFALTILGNNSAIPAFNRNPTAQVLQCFEEKYLIDCGEGTQLQISKYKIRSSKISHIFISHLHGDHYFGLIGLISSMSMLNRTQDLHLHAPEALEEILQLQMKVANNKLSFNLFFHPLKEEGIITKNNKITVECFKVKHRIECWGFLFREIKNPRKLDAEKIKTFKIPSSFYDKLQMGEDYTTQSGSIIKNETVTVAAPLPKSYGYCADTIYDESLADKVKGVDLLYHETTYLNGNETKAAERFHCTTQQAGKIAELAKVKKLLIGHFSAKYEILDEFLNETAAVFPNTELALEGICFRI